MQQQQQLPYIPLVFVKTGVIGGKKTQKNDIYSQYDYAYRDYLKPHLIENHNAVFYILFHSASVYNWLRTIPSKESQLLNRYITTDKGEKSFNSVNTHQIIASLEDYASRWQAVKLTFSSSVYVSKVRQSGSQSCSHLAKTQQNVIQLCFDAKSKSMNSNKVKCKECKRVVEVQGQLRSVGNGFVSRNVQFSLQIKQKKYEAFILYSKRSIFVKCAYKIWFEINLQNGTSKVVGIHAINLKQIELAVYQTFWETKDRLQQAKPIELYSNSKIDPQASQKQHKNLMKIPAAIEQQEIELKVEKLRKDQSKNTKNNSKQNNESFKTQKDDEKISQLKFTPNKVILRKQEFDRQYIEHVQKQFIKPKVKDEYQLDYDKGKLKKIKQKKNYVQPDYNQIYAVLKKQEKSGKFEQSKKIRKERRNQKRENRYNQKDSDEDYN